MSAGAAVRRPVVATSTDEWLSAVYDRLGQVLDRLPDRSTPAAPDGTVEIREPKARATGRKRAR